MGSVIVTEDEIRTETSNFRGNKPLLLSALHCLFSRPNCTKLTESEHKQEHKDEIPPSFYNSTISRTDAITFQS
jgi:hypothetical protein